MTKHLTPAQLRVKEAEEALRAAREAMRQARDKEKEEAQEHDARLRYLVGGLTLEWAEKAPDLMERIRKELPASLTKEDHKRGTWYRLFDEDPPEPAAQDETLQAAHDPHPSRPEGASLGDEPGNGQGPVDHHQAPSAVPHEHGPEHHPR